MRSVVICRTPGIRAMIATFACIGVERLPLITVSSAIVIIRHVKPIRPGQRLPISREVKHNGCEPRTAKNRGDYINAVLPPKVVSPPVSQTEIPKQESSIDENAFPGRPGARLFSGGPQSLIPLVGANGPYKADDEPKQERSNRYGQIDAGKATTIFHIAQNISAVAHRDCGKETKKHTHHSFLSAEGILAALIHAPKASINANEYRTGMLRICIRLKDLIRKLAPAALLTLASTATAQEMTPRNLDLPDDWRPTVESFWISDDEIAVIAQQRAAGDAAYALMTRHLEQSAWVQVLPLAGPAHCTTPDGRLLRSDTRETPRVVIWTVEKGAEPLDDPQAFSRCKAHLALLNKTNEARLGRQGVLATNGHRSAGLLAAGDDATEIVLYDAERIHRRWKVLADLWRDPAKAEARPDGSFLFYTQIGVGRHSILASRYGLNGLPAFVIDADGTFAVLDLPWLNTRRVGFYKIVETRAGWVLATSHRRADMIGGLYALQPHGWEQIRHSDLLPETLKVSPDGCRLLWHERDPHWPVSRARQIRMAHFTEQSCRPQ